jgi:hypothetical protein
VNLACDEDLHLDVAVEFVLRPRRPAAEALDDATGAGAMLDSFLPFRAGVGRRWKTYNALATIQATKMTATM